MTGTSATPTPATPDLGPAARWTHGGYAQQYAWDQCKYCGRAATSDCKPAACMLCGTVQCHGNGANCRVCYVGFIPGWARMGWDAHLCGKKNCEQPAVAKAPIVARVCAGHAATTKMRAGGRSLTIVEYAAQGVAHRDCGKGWERWRYVA